MEPLRSWMVTRVRLGNQEIILTVSVVASIWKNYNATFSRKDLVGANNKTSMKFSKMKTQTDRLTYYKHVYQYVPPETAKHIKKRKKTFCGSQPEFVDFFELKYDLRSEHDEDKFLYHTFFNKVDSKQARYIEIGGYDGLMRSNSRSLTNV